MNTNILVNIYNNNMLLNDLIKLMNISLNIDEFRLIELMKKNNIKIEQRLLMEKKEVSINKESKSTNANNADNTQIKRGRGRPRKSCLMLEDDCVGIEVELIIIDDVEYYKTQEEVILNKNQEIMGILINGKIVKKE